ncbi:tetratricopeptide repeat protein [Alicyclobacillus acidoterrestris]|uniref:tetratricopeptide repeat protein n=1 Tax=Alicyclobacillus acidoterrestris TaxID=1450 RepID=UPI003F53873B
MQNLELKDIANAVLQIREQVPEADARTKERMLQDLAMLRELATSVLDAWMEVDDVIEETILEIGEVEQAGDLGQDDASSAEARSEAWSASRTESLLQGPVEIAQTWFDLSLKVDCALRRGLGYFDLRMFDEAAASLSEALDGQDNPAARIYLALSHLAAGRIDLAASHLAFARDAAADEMTLQAVLEVEVQLCAAKEDWHQAVHVLYELLSLDPHEVDVWYNLGICHLKLYEFAAAERCFAKAMRTETVDVEAILWRAMSLVLSGRVDEGRALLTHSEQMGEQLEQHALLRVVLYLSTQQMDLAEQTAGSVIMKYPNQAIGYELLALCRAVSHRPREAMIASKRALALRPEGSHALTLFGLTSYLLGDFSRAKAALEAAEKNGDASALTQIIRARIAALDGQTDEARRRLGQLTEHPGMYAKRLAILYRGMLHLREGESALANADFERAVHLGLPPSAIAVARAHVESEIEQSEMQLERS